MGLHQYVHELVTEPRLITFIHASMVQSPCDLNTCP
jgi:hypothetical protein